MNYVYVDQISLSPHMRRRSNFRLANHVWVWNQKGPGMTIEDTVIYDLSFCLAL
jgi:hypothetical protein